jgi:3-oxoacyl-[acyl-carrier-protein] synthase II
MTGPSVFTRQSKPERRVVVTGVGMITPLGNTVAENWQNAKAGKSGVGLITQFDTARFDVKIAGEVKGFDPVSIIEKKEIKKMDRFTQFALKATDEAIRDSGIDFAANELLRARTGALIGVGIGGLQSIENQTSTYITRGPDRITPFFIPLVITNMAAGHVTIRYGLRGPNYSVTSACASGVHSIGEAARYIQDGTCDVMVAGGVESAITPLAIAGFNAMKALSTRNDAPEKASRPFDRGRDGFVLAEAGGVVILEDYEHASRRGAKIYAELTGYGVSSDAYHMTSPPMDGAGDEDGP